MKVEEDLQLSKSRGPKLAKTDKGLEVKRMAPTILLMWPIKTSRALALMARGEM